MQDTIDTVNRRRCCVPGCNSQSIPFSFYKFPKNAKNSSRTFDVDRYEEWKRRTGITTTNENTVVCSRHFTEDDYYYPGWFYQLSGNT